MQKSTVQTNHQDPYNSPTLEVLDFLLKHADKDYERVVISMYEQQMSSIKTYLWTSNLFFTGIVFILLQTKDLWTTPSVSFCSLGFIAGLIFTSLAIFFMLSSFFNPFRRPFRKFPDWIACYEESLKNGNSPLSTEIYIKKEILAQYEDAIKNGNMNLNENGKRLRKANTLLRFALGSVTLSFVFIIPKLL